MCYIVLLHLNLKHLTYSMVQDILWKADSHSACYTIACFLYGTWRFITVFTKAYHWNLSWASWIHFTPSLPILLRSILMLSSHLCLGLPSGLFPLGLHQNPVNTSSFPQVCQMSCPPHPPWFNHPNNIWWRMLAMKFLLGQNTSSILCSQKPSVYIPPSKWEAKFHTHTVQLAKLQFVYFNL
jgi:hypothetical protein